jgi:PmbA protein
LLGFLAMLVVGLSSALGARAMLDPARQRPLKSPLVEPGARAGADAADASMSATARRRQVRLGELEDVSRSEARRSACGCSSASARRRGGLVGPVDEALAALVERCLAMAREAPEDPMPGSRRTSC